MTGGVGGERMTRLGWVAVTVVVVALGAGVLILDRRQAARGAPSLLGIPWVREAVRAAPAGPPERRLGAGRAAPARPEGSGRIAVIVEELGSRADVFERVLALSLPVTVAVLPELPLSRRIARDASRAGLEVLLQLPLEPYRFPEQDPGPGPLLVSMAPAEVTRRTRQLLDGTPGVAGVLTHMGSRFTEDRERMEALIAAVRSQNLLFVDGLTTPRSAGYDVARALGVRAARRQVRLDPDESEATARARLSEAERWALRRGSVVVIARGRLMMIGVLGEAARRWDALGLRIVPISALAS
jgi:polysaccharide deacetylase 2 family uncharacterized protein YibQ